MDSKKRLPWVLGIDLGTGSCKSVVAALDGQVLGFGACDYGGEAVTERWKEQDPQALLNGMVIAVRTAVMEASVTAENCQGVSLGGAMHTLMAVDRSGRPLTGIITWVDDRAARQAQQVASSPYSMQIYRRTGCPVHCIYPLYKILWLRQERAELFQQTARFLSAKEYVLARLTGEYVVDPGIAAGSGLLQVDKLQWEDCALELAGIKPSHLSVLQSPLYSLPLVEADLARSMGLMPGTRVVLGASDAVNSSLGAGAVRSDQATCMIGSSGAFRIISTQPILDERARSWCYAIDNQHWLVGGAINNGGLALTWLCDRLNHIYLERTGASAISLNDLIHLAEQVEAGSNGLICLPFFAGERSPYWNMNARGVFFGLSLEHDLRHMARSLLEGVAFRLRSVKEALEENGISILRVRASGGFTKSPLWLQIVTDVLNRSLVVPQWGETSSLGAAFWVLLAIGAVENLASLERLVPLGDFYEPIGSNATLYDQLYSIYKEIYCSSLSAFDRLRAVS